MVVAACHSVLLPYAHRKRPHEAPFQSQRSIPRAQRNSLNIGLLSPFRRPSLGWYDFCVSESHLDGYANWGENP